MCIGCSDPFVTYLKSIGYNAIRLPRADIRPLQILARTGKELDWLGDLSQLFQSSVPVPSIRLNETAADVSGQRSGELSLGIGLSLLGNLIGAMGGSKLGANAAYRGASSIVFQFADVLRDSVATIDLDKYLGKSDVDPAAVTIGKMLDADVVYVTTATVKSNKYTVESKKSSGADFDVDVPVIQQAVGTSLKVSGKTATTAVVSFDGLTPLVFGFQAVQLFYDKGRYTAFKPTGAGTVTAKTALSNAPNDGADRFVSEGTFALIN